MQKISIVIAAVLALSAPALAKKKKDEKADAHAQMMAQMAKYSTPGAQHKLAEKQFVGMWTTHTKAWMAPGQPPAESDGSNDCKAIMGGRFFEESYKSTMNGQPFEGHGIFGYDLGTQKYFSFWIDSMGTWPSFLWGTWDEASKTYTFAGDSFDPMQGKMAPMKYLMKIESDNKHTLEIYGNMGGKEVKMLEIAYTRK